MSLLSNIDFLDKTIATQRSTLRFHLGWAFGVVGLGVGAIALVQRAPGSAIPENLKWLLTIGGGFISSLSSFPLKEIFSRRDKITALVFLRHELARLQASATPVDAPEIQRLEQRFWQFIDKSLGG